MGERTHPPSSRSWSFPFRRPRQRWWQPCSWPRRSRCRSWRALRAVVLAGDCAAVGDVRCARDVRCRWCRGEVPAEVGVGKPLVEDSELHPRAPHTANRVSEKRLRRARGAGMSQRSMAKVTRRLNPFVGLP
jgi:hypothetical protein